MPADPCPLLRPPSPWWRVRPGCAGALFLVCGGALAARRAWLAARPPRKVAPLTVVVPSAPSPTRAPAAAPKPRPLARAKVAPAPLRTDPGWQRRVAAADAAADAAAVGAGAGAGNADDGIDLGSVAPRGAPAGTTGVTGSPLRRPGAPAALAPLPRGGGDAAAAAAAVASPGQSLAPLGGRPLAPLGRPLGGALPVLGSPLARPLAPLGRPLAPLSGSPLRGGGLGGQLGPIRGLPAVAAAPLSAAALEQRVARAAASGGGDDDDDAIML